eukprot:383639-Rhodomonas_salina.2
MFSPARDDKTYDLRMSGSEACEFEETRTRVRKGKSACQSGSDNNSECEDVVSKRLGAVPP